jgi:hypothetical protein
MNVVDTPKIRVACNNNTPQVPSDFMGAKELCEVKAVTTSAEFAYNEKKWKRFAAQQFCQMFCADESLAPVNHLYVTSQQGSIEPDFYSRVRFNADVWDRCMMPQVRRFVEFLRSDTEPSPAFTRWFTDHNRRFGDYVVTHFRPCQVTPYSTSPLVVTE